jgi:hypothetical protein
MTDSQANNPMLAVFESMTGPDKEDQTLLVLHDRTVMATCLREFPAANGRRTEGRQFRIPLDEFNRMFETLPANHNLGHVNLIIPTDPAKETWEVQELLHEAARRSNFSFTFMFGQVTTKRSLKAMKARFTTVH